MVLEFLLDRMSATMRMVVLGTMPMGALIGGVLGQSLGIWPTFLLAGLGHLLPLLWSWICPVQALTIPTVTHSHV